MNDIKLIATDLDGTLLNNDHKMSDYTLHVWKKVQQKGIHILPVTGRPLMSMMNGISYDICEYSINTNGVHIYTHNNNITRKIWEKNMSWEVAQNIINYATIHIPHVYMQVYIEDELFTNPVEYVDEYYRPTFSSYKEIEDWKILEGRNISKIIFFHTHEILKTIKADIDILPHVNSMFSMPTHLEVLSNTTSKGLALQFIMEQLHIAPDNVLGIGDSYNDISMLEVCGMPFIMKNATIEMAQYIPRTTYTNDEHGVAKLIQELIL